MDHQLHWLLVTVIFLPTSYFCMLPCHQLAALHHLSSPVMFSIWASIWLTKYWFGGHFHFNLQWRDNDLYSCPRYSLSMAQSLVRIAVCHCCRLDGDNINYMQHLVTCWQHDGCDIMSTCIFVTSQHAIKTDYKIHHQVVYYVTCSLLPHNMQHYVTCCKCNLFSHKKCMSPMLPTNLWQMMCRHDMSRHIPNNSN